MCTLSCESMAIDGNGGIHIAYGGDHLYHAYYDGFDWDYETVDASCGVGLFTSIAIDSQDKVHISYYDYTNEDLKYITSAIQRFWYPGTCFIANIYKVIVCRIIKGDVHLVL